MAALFGGFIAWNPGSCEKEYKLQPGQICMSGKLIVKGTNYKAAPANPDFFKMIPKEALLYDVVALDLDGTILDTKPYSYWAGMKAFEKLGLAQIPEERWHAAFAIENHFKNMYKSLGVPDKELVGEGFDYPFAKLWNEERIKLEKEDLPKLVPGARETIENICSLVGREHMFIVSMSKPDRIARLFKGQNMIQYFNGMFASHFDKTKTLGDLKALNPEKRTIYFSDICYDGEACKANSITFGILKHRYGFDPEKTLYEYALKHDDCVLVEGFENIPHALIEVRPC